MQEVELLAGVHLRSKDEGRGRSQRTPMAITLGLCSSCCAPTPGMMRSPLLLEGLRGQPGGASADPVL